MSHTSSPLHKPIEIKVMLLSSTAIVPTKGTTMSAGYDLYADKDGTILPGQTVLAGTGIAIQLADLSAQDRLQYARIAERSGLAYKHGISIGGGVIDADYTGEIKVIMHNTSGVNFAIRQGDRIAQLIIYDIPITKLVLADSLADTERGAGGFGSTGK